MSLQVCLPTDILDPFSFFSRLFLPTHCTHSFIYPSLPPFFSPHLSLSYLTPLHVFMDLPDTDGRVVLAKLTKTPNLHWVVLALNILVEA